MASRPSLDSSTKVEKDISSKGLQSMVVKSAFFDESDDVSTEDTELSRRPYLHACVLGFRLCEMART